MLPAGRRPPPREQSWRVEAGVEVPREAGSLGEGVWVCEAASVEAQLTPLPSLPAPGWRVGGFLLRLTPQNFLLTL